MTKLRVQKRYVHRVSGDTRTLRGTIETDDPDEIRRLMGRRMLQTIDPRIVWDDSFMEGDGWDYEDFSFDFVPTDEELDDKYKALEDADRE